MKLVKVMQNQRRKPNGFNLVGAYNGGEMGEHSNESEAGESQEPEPGDDESVMEGIAAILAMGLAPSAQEAEICAFVNKRFARKTPAGGARGASGRPGAGAGARRDPPPPPRSLRHHLRELRPQGTWCR